jgi:tRNA pseudouridine38-40 synthase
MPGPRRRRRGPTRGPAVPRYMLTVAYDGTDFCGWQKQEPPAAADVGAEKVLAAAADPRPGEPPRLTLRTVQEVVERAVRRVVREPVELIGASRTDAGVHARGQVAAFTCSEGDGGCGWPLSRGVDTLVRAINSGLPEDVLVMGARPAADDFNPIGGARSKAYSYTLHVSPSRPIWDRRYVHHIWTDLDLDAMNAAAAELVGEHDFAAFAAAGHGRQSTVRTVFDCRVRAEAVHDEPAGSAGGGGSRDFASRRVRIDVAGSGFLYNMVRIIAGTLVEAGRGRLAPGDVRSALETGDRRRAGPTLPPCGLCLEWVRY